MKAIKFSQRAFGFLTALAATASTAIASPMVWPDQQSKFVSVAAEPSLTVLLEKLDSGDPNYYASLQVSLSYTTQESRQAYQATAQQFSGFTIQNVILEKGGPYHYRLPLLNIESDVDPSPGQEGPYFDDTQYLNKAQYQTIQNAISNRVPIVTLEGQIVANVASMKVVEHREVNADTCAKLAPQGTTLKTLIENAVVFGLPALFKMPVQHTETLTSLVNDIEDNCFELNQQSPIRSFSDLLTTQILAKNPGRSLHGEFKMKSFDRQNIPLSFQLIQKTIAGGSK